MEPRTGWGTRKAFMNVLTFELGFDMMNRNFLDIMDVVV